MDPDGDLFRRQLLQAFGASGATLDALLAYNLNPFATDGFGALPLPDEPHLTAWDDYLQDARSSGVFDALAARLVQLQFPIQAGISQTETYRAATRRGRPPDAGAPGLALERPQDLQLTIEKTLAGRIPVLVTPCRHDFVALFRACTARNEPEPVRDSVGACIVTGLNNWDRVARHRQRIEEERGAPLDASEWAAEFSALVPRKELYQDRFIILSGEPYSAVPAREVGLDEETWRVRSVEIRRAHECTHYFTLRAFGVMRNNLLDELLADFAGLAAAFGRYDGRLALRFLGLDVWPDRRPGGRFEQYLGTPPIEAPAVEVLHGLIVAAVSRLDAFLGGADLHSPGSVARLLVALAGLTIEEMADESLPVRLADRLSKAPALA